MAKKPQNPATPEITVLPMTGGDSPMVIDLPDGQKLIVSNLAAGSVIEVATWRGTGRPDSRTTRLMLGMTSAQAKTAESTSSESKDSSLSTGAKVIKKALSLLRNFVLELKSRKKYLAEKKKKAPLIEKVVPPARTSEDLDVDDWLNSILEKSAKKTPVVKKETAKTPAKKPEVKKTAQKKVTKKTTSGRAK
ncbi:unannotated protein [freshwater metagenome]|uniref:Unannotated protein n=1 Tax=freshwater metagenome TaxID=449393 RepID=A0A6J5YPU0_9ZZZZ|nr:hypothetical protein [Actinomycetota bacterium]